MSIPIAELTGIQLYVLGDKDNELDSHVKIFHQDSMKGNYPYPNGIYDDHMGTTSPSWKCGTCRYDKKLCPGHFGSINLNYPVLSPMFIKDIQKWLKIICFNCGKVIIPVKPLPIVKDKILSEYAKMVRTSSKDMVCIHCEAIHPHITKDKTDPISIFMEVYDTRSGSTGKGTIAIHAQLYPHQVSAIFNKISDYTCLQMGKPLKCHPRKLVLEVLRAPPNTIRPDIQKIGSGRSNSNDLTVLLQAIVRMNEGIAQYRPAVIDDNLRSQIHNLNLAVYDLIKGSSSANKRSIVNNSKKPLTSVSKRLPRKHGRIRRNLMGRRANHMARSFITCDVFLKNDEIGIPISIARNIPIPEIVREYNYDQCMIYFQNGTERYPGCSKVKKANNGKEYYVKFVKNLEIGDIIYRDIVTGDYVDVNRQPSLLSGNISCMRAVVMEKGDTLLINVDFCILLNADFDGDAINVLFSSNQRVINEIKNLSSPANFAISYKDGSPTVLGEVQDALVGLSDLTKTRTLVDKYHAMQIFNQVKIYHDFSQYPKDKMFTGREIISIYLKESGNEINYSGTPSSYIEDHAKFRKYDADDIKVEIDRGTLKTGVLDKSSVGQERRGNIFHIIHNQYGAKTALDASHDVQQLGIAYLYYSGLTVGINDILLQPQDIDEIHKIEQSLIAESLEITDRLNQGKIIPPMGKMVGEYYEQLQINALNPSDQYWEYILRSIDPENNNLYKMITTGARGKLYIFNNISSAIGQLDINGERMKENFAGRTLPFFTRYDADPGSRGHINNSYISGLLETEFFFHTQETRYQLINKALSTSITGMHNRMAIKNLEALIVDNQRKIINGDKIIQLLYGADGTDPRAGEQVKFPTMHKDLDKEKFETMFHANHKLFEKEFQNAGVQKLLDAEFDQLKQDREFYVDLFLKMEITSNKIYSDSKIMPVNINRIMEDITYNLELRKYKDQLKLNPVKTMERVRELTDKIVYCLLNEIQEHRKREVPSYLLHAVYLIRVLIRSYLNTATLLRRGINDEALELICRKIKLTYSRGLVSYGKAMGIIAAQSISEPMTQMVLDSHHTSGSSSTKKKGMFRIREILSARPSSRMKAPSMTLHVKPEYESNESKVREIANYIEMLNLRRFVNDWQIFHEKYGQPVHPNYKHETKLIKEFEKYNVNVKTPSDLANWCIRMNLDKSKLIEKQMRTDTIYHKIRQEFPATHIVYSTDNAENIIIRIYVRGIISKKSIDLKQMRELVKNILDVIIRGVKGVKAAYVQNKSVSRLSSSGAVESQKIHYIFCDGTNIKEILENPYIDPDTVQSDSILEMYDVCGITAARQKIIDELKHQIEGSNHKHYELYANVMTSQGNITSIDRYGSAKRNSSIMLRISDASPIGVIEESAINNFSDGLSGVSPPIMLGKNAKVGDVYNSFIMDEDFLADKIKDVNAILDEL